MCGYYALLLYFNEWLYHRFRKNRIYKYNPIFSGIFLILPLMLTGRALVGFGSKVREIVLLVFACTFAVSLMAAYHKHMEPVDVKKDRIIFIVPAAVQLYYIAVMLIRKISAAYVPVCVTTFILCIYLGLLYRQGKRAESSRDSAYGK